MELQFFKYQGTGNDFIMVDNRAEVCNLSASQIARLCDRRFGIGADGLILLQEEEGLDFRMLYYNADGNEGSMCGNGGRCTVQFASDLNIFTSQTAFMAVDGLHEAQIKDNEVNLKMADTLTMELKHGHHYYNTGSPHVIVEVTNLDELNVFEEGGAIRNTAFWQNLGGTNVNFVQVQGLNKIKVRTFERGVEAETFSCGTGVTAAALDMFTQYSWNGPVEIETLGGNLTVSFEANQKFFNNIWLKGPAKRVFSGEVELK